MESTLGCRFTIANAVLRFEPQLPLPGILRKAEGEPSGQRGAPTSRNTSAISTLTSNTLPAAPTPGRRCGLGACHSHPLTVPCAVPSRCPGHPCTGRRRPGRRSACGPCWTWAWTAACGTSTRVRPWPTRCTAATRPACGSSPAAGPGERGPRFSPPLSPKSGTFRLKVPASQCSQRSRVFLLPQELSGKLSCVRRRPSSQGAAAVARGPVGA